MCLLGCVVAVVCLSLDQGSDSSIYSVTHLRAFPKVGIYLMTLRNRDGRGPEGIFFTTNLQRASELFARIFSP